MARLLVKNAHKKDMCYKEMWSLCSKHGHYFRVISEQN